MFLGKILSQFVSDDPVDYMDQPPAGLAIQGLLRSAFVEDNSVINKQIFDDQSNNEEENQISEEEEEEDLGVVNGHRHSSQDDLNAEQELQKDQVSGNGTSYYKLEMVKIHLISAHGNQVFWDIDITYLVLEYRSLKVVLQCWSLFEVFMTFLVPIPSKMTVCENSGTENLQIT